MEKVNAQLIDGRIYFNDGCKDCPIAGSAECLMFCGDTIENALDACEYVDRDIKEEYIQPFDND